MITIYKSEKITEDENGKRTIMELRGLSTDTKPTIINNTTIENGSVFIEIDTGKVYLYDLSTETWMEV